MAKKNKTLPKDFAEIVKRGNLEELKAVFDKCEINAHERYGSKTALFYQGITPEFVRWLVAQGADVNFRKDFAKDTPLSQQVQYKPTDKAKHEINEKLLGYRSDIVADNTEILELLIELGAEVEPSSTFNSPLTQACRAINPTAVKTLLKHGANPLNDIYQNYNSPLLAVIERSAPTPDTLEIVEILLSYGVPITDWMRELIGIMGKSFENRKLAQPTSKYKEHEAYYINQFQPVMEKLYEIFDVEPIKPRKIYDGVSPIYVEQTDDLQQAFQTLWDYLVLPSGQCSTVQGEVIRITGKIADEIGRNGGHNWKDDHKKMLDSLMTYFAMGNSLSNAQLTQAEAIKKQVYFGNQHRYEQAVELSNLAVLWVKANPNPIAVNNPPYQF